MLAIVVPKALVFTAVWPLKDAKARSLINIVLPSIFSTIWPTIPTIAMHSRLIPRSPESSSIDSSVLSTAMKVVLSESTSELGAIRKTVNAPSFLETVAIRTSVSGAICPNLYSMSILAISAPLAFVFCQILVVINAITMGYIESPFTNINIAITMQKSTSSFSTIVLPLAFVSCSICPQLHTKAMAYIASPLPIVDSTTSELVTRSTEPTRTCHWRRQTDELFQLSLEVV
mmetsp:Transcript_23039/g.36781  ORF Transcript_23039/g.36781 Transcript_23039/m.36781 type:complete len:231 (-) Transcript_23039:214-906(-)